MPRMPLNEPLNSPHTYAMESLCEAGCPGGRRRDRVGESGVWI